MAATTRPPGVCKTKSIGVVGGVSLLAAMIVCASSYSMSPDTEKPKRLRFSCRWIIVIILELRDFSIALIACIRFVADQRPIRSG